ncbi:hypothetical protein P120_gp39 [Pelagibacter phage HTVC120P]|nr:hypothetical protein P120_gp39 [Pelagibacter phage HTVC120P]
MVQAPEASLTTKSKPGVFVLIPTLLFELSTYKVSVSTTKPPVTVAVPVTVAPVDVVSNFFALS